MCNDAEIKAEEIRLNDLASEKQLVTSDGQRTSVELNVEDEVTSPGRSNTHRRFRFSSSAYRYLRTHYRILLLSLALVLLIVVTVVTTIPNVHHGSEQSFRCNCTVKMKWWNEGPLYQIPDVTAFADGMKGLQEKLDSLKELKVKVLVLGPLHIVQPNKLNTLKLQSIDPILGKIEHFTSVLEKAHENGIKVVLDLTPNYKGHACWFFSDDRNKLMVEFISAVDYWLRLGLDGIQIRLLYAFKSPLWPKLLDAIHSKYMEDTTERVLIGVVRGVSASEVSHFANKTGVDILLSDLLSSNNKGMERIKDMEALNMQQTHLGWGLGATQQDQLSTQAKTPAVLRLYQLLLFTMPGTPVFTYGDEIGLQAGQGSPKMVWGIETEPAEGSAANKNPEAERKQRVALRKWFISLSEMRGKEPSLLHGRYYSLASSSSSLAFLRLWDQCEGYITAVNWGTMNETLTLNLAPTEGVKLPELAKVKLSTDENMAEASSISLDKITLRPETAVLLYFPYEG